MEAILWAWVVASNPRRIGLISASISLHVCHDFLHDFRHDHATIGPRSGVNLTAQASSIDCRSMGADSAPFPLHFRFDRGSIVPRSRLDRAAIAARSCRDRGSIAARSRRDRVLPGVSSAVRLFDRDEDPMLQVRSRSRDRMIFPSPRGHRLSLRSRHLR